MKTTLLLSAMFLFATVSFAQTNVKNNEAVTDHASIKSNEDGTQFKNSAHASSATKANSHAAKKAENKTRAKIRKEKKAIASEKNATATEASAKGQETKKEALEHMPDHAAAHANAQAGGTGEGGKANANTSVNGGAAVSADVKKDKIKEVKNKEKAAVKTEAAATIETADQAKTNVDKVTVNAGKKVKSNVHSKAAFGHSMQAQHTPVKVNTGIKTNAGIHIK